MLGKLIKHEYIYIIKTFTPVYIVYLIAALLVRCFTFLADSDFEPEGAFGFTIVAVVFCITTVFGFLAAFMAMMTIVSNVRRFKKNMFSDEGYLTNTLPVTATEHIAAKVIAGATNYIISFIVLFIGIFIVSNEASIGVIKDLYEVIIDDAIPVGVKLSGVLLSFMVFLSLLLLFYLTTALNSMTNSKGCLGALVLGAALFFGIFAISRIFAEMMTTDFFLENPTASILIFCAFFAACSAVMYVILVNIIKNHLNLQ
ncbi:MAG: hypothetical protein IJ071_09535 [Ruminococcus sp.]|nr:hypothetical protein [Ruminococcus sp.]